MLKVRIIPCLDVKDGRVVKGINFVGLRDAGDPVEQAMLYDKMGADELCFLDITASHEKRAILLDVVRRTADVCFMPLTVGGGCARWTTSVRFCWPAPTRSRSTPRRCAAPNSFAKPRRSSAASASLPPSTPKRARIRTTTRPSRSSPMVAQPHGLDAVAHAVKLVGYGAGEILLTSMDRDGTKIGYDIQLTRAIADAVPVPVIASAGGHSRASGGGCARRARQRSAGRLDLPFRPMVHRRGQGGSCQSRLTVRNV